MSTETSFGFWVKRRRKALDLTQQELARKVGCSVSLIFKMEADERRPSRQIAELLVEALEIPPNQRDLFFKVARQQKGTQALDSIPALGTPPPGSAGDPAQTHLPVPLTSLIGREHELQMILQQLQNTTCRLLTLTGPGGVGKTRLALEVALKMHAEFGEAICFVSLAGTSGIEFMISAIADALGFVFFGTADPKLQLLKFLKEKYLLLVLDNLEHLLSGIELLDELLEYAPLVKILATSREQLNLRAEWTFEVQGLPVPSATAWDAAVPTSAASLFIERARQTRPDFTPSQEDLQAIAHICQLVDGLPLGLELAAAWVRTLSCPEIEIEIRRSLDFLTTTKRDIPERHRSLRAVFDYSWNLLTEEEKSVLKKLSLFKGGFQREAAEQVTDANLSMLSVLVGKSLIHRNEAQAGRYEQHELVRQYATIRRLQENIEAEVSSRNRHADYYLGLWGARENKMKSPQQWETVRELSTDIDNFRAAWEWAISQGQLGAISQCLRTLLLVYDVRGWYVEGLERLGAVTRKLSNDMQAQHAVTLGLVSCFQGWFHFRRGQLQEARRRFDYAISTLRTSNDAIALAEVLALYGPLLTSLGEGDQAVAAARESLDFAHTTKDAWHIAYALMMQGGILSGRGEFEEAYRSCHEALTHFRKLGDTRLTVVTLNTLGFVALRLSRYTEARNVLKESLSLVSPSDDPWSVGTAYGNLGIVELAQGNGAEAQKALQNSIAVFTDLGMLGDLVFYLAYLGEAYILQGEMDKAESHLRDALLRSREIQALPDAMASLIRLAQVHVERGDVIHAYVMAVFVFEHPASWQESKYRAAELLEKVEAQLTPDRIEAGRARAQSLSLDTVLEGLADHSQYK